MSEPTPNLELLEELTAYLDGELASDARERVEQRLASDADYRRELQRLERSWELLDRLPRSTVDDTFTQTTLEMVAIAAEEDLETEQATQPRKQLKWAIAAAAGLLLMGLAGFALGHRIWPDPNRELLRDLPVVSNLDLYQHAGNVDFLRKLVESKRLPQDETLAPPTAWNSLDDAARRKYVENLSPEQQQNLLKQSQRFHEFAREEQTRLRELQADLEHDSQAPQLYQAMWLYHEWLKTLSPAQRAELVELKPEDRLPRIKEFEEQRRPSTADSKMLTQEDVRRVGAWIEGLVWKYKDRILADAPAQRRAQLESMDEPMRRRALMISALQRWQSTGLTDLTPTQEELQQLLQQLSPPAQQRLTAANTPQEKKALLKEWIGLAVQQRLETWGRVMAMVDERELERFFTEDLTRDERDRLLAMPRDQMQHELKKLYLQGTGRRPGMRPLPGPPRPDGLVPPRPGGFNPQRRNDAATR